MKTKEPKTWTFAYRGKRCVVLTAMEFRWQIFWCVIFASGFVIPSYFKIAEFLNAYFFFHSRFEFVVVLLSFSLSLFLYWHSIDKNRSTVAKKCKKVLHFIVCVMFSFLYSFGFCCFGQRFLCICPNVLFTYLKTGSMHTLDAFESIACKRCNSMLNK